MGAGAAFQKHKGRGFFAWSSLEVSEWLEAMGLRTYSKYFLHNGVDGRTLLKLTPEEISLTLGISDPMHRLAFDVGLAQLKQGKARGVGPGDDYSRWLWSAERVGEWLVSLGLDSLRARFESNAVHGGVLFSLKEAQFADGACLAVGTPPDSPLLLRSLMLAVEHVQKYDLPACRSEPEQAALPEGLLVKDWPLRPHVQDWLHSRHLEHLFPAFARHGVHGAFLLKLRQTT